MIALRGLEPEVRRRAEWAHAWARHYGVPVTVTSAFRSLSDQATLRRRFEDCVETGRFRDGSTVGCQFPANRPGDSAHNFGLAWDSVTPDRFVTWWSMVRNRAGFRVPAGDVIHAEVPSWRTFV